MVVRMKTLRILILTDEAKTFKKPSKSNTLFDIYSGSFSSVKNFYGKLTEESLRVDLKVLLNSNLVINAFDEAERISPVSISKFLSNINYYNVLVILLSKNRLFFFLSEYRKNNINFRGDIFIVGSNSLRNEINEVFHPKK